LYVDDEKVADRAVALAAGAEAAVTFSHVFARAGASAVEVRLGPDDLAADNARYLAVNVQERLPVLIVDGDPSNVPYLSESFFLNLALQPPSAVGRQRSPVQATVVTASEFLRKRLEDYGCVILANVPRIDDLAAERLRRYVEAGGGLLVFLGDRVAAPSYNAALCPAGQEPVLPVQLGELMEAEAESGFRVRSVAGGHPALQGVGDMVTGGATRIEKLFSVQPHEGRREASVLIELDAGPLVLESKAGAGCVVLVTSSADLAWGNLAARRAFLPLLHRLVCYAGRSGTAAQDVPVGAPYVVELPPDDAPVEVSVYGPADAQEPVAVLTSARADGAHRALFTATRRPGLYRAAYQGTERIFAVNVEEGESDLTPLDPDEATAMLGAGVRRFVPEPVGLAGLMQREREGLPLWNYLFALAMAFAVVEGFIGNVALKH